jgi:hypothetical protein
VGVVLVPPTAPPPFPRAPFALPLWRAVTSAAPPSLPLALLAKSVQVHGFYSWYLTTSSFSFFLSLRLAGLLMST